MRMREWCFYCSGFYDVGTAVGARDWIISWKDTTFIKANI